MEFFLIVIMFSTVAILSLVAAAVGGLYALYSKQE